MLDRKAIVILTTTPNQRDAEDLAEKLVQARLAACVQVLPEIKSFYHWQNAVRRDAETLLFIKTTEDKFTAVEDFITANHSYEVPEIVALPASQVSAAYLSWLQESVK